MNFARRLQTERGFTLAETMIGIGVSVVVTLGIAQSFDLLARGKKSIEMGSDAVEWTQEVRQTMRNADQCQIMLQNKILPNLAGGKTNIGSVKLGTKTYTVGTDIKPGLRLVALDLMRNAVAKGVSTIYQPPSGASVSATQYVGLIHIQLDKAAGLLGGGSGSKHVYFPVKVMTDGANKVLGCSYAGNLAEAACVESGFKWNASTKQCIYRLGQCQYAGSYVSRTFTNGTTTGGFTNPFTGGYSCPTDYEPRLSGSYNKAESCGKGCLRNLLAPVYECVKCYDAAGNYVSPGATASLNFVPEDLNVSQDIDDGTDEVSASLASAVSTLQNNWQASGAACYTTGTKFSGGASCVISGGASELQIPASMCCSGKVRVCQNRYTIPLVGTYDVPNYMDCK